VKKIDAQRILLYILLFGTMIMFGLVDNIRGVSFPLIRNEFDVPFEWQGLMVSALSLAVVISNIITGILLKRFGAKPATLVGCLGICIGLVLVFFMPGFFSVALALFVVSFGFGFLDIGINALASQVFVVKAALMMNLLHSFFGIGSIMGPQVARLAVGGEGLGWRYAYIFLLPLLLLLFAIALIARFPKDGSKASAGGNSPDVPDDPVKRKNFFDALKMPMVWLIALTLGVATVIESNTPNWGLLYFQDVYGIDPAVEGATFLSAFFLLFTVSRLVCGSLVERLGYVRSLIGVAVLTFAVLVAGFLLGTRGIFVLPALGFLVALFWPTMMAVAIVSFGRDAPVCAGAIIAIAGIVNSAAQFLVGLTNRAIGPAWGYRSTLVYTVILIFVLLALYKNLKRHNIKNI